VPVHDWATFDWDAVRISSRVDGEAYQEGPLQGLRHPDGLLRLLDERGRDEGRDLVCFAGTLPLITGEFVAGTAWELRMALPDGRTISHTYEARKV
jgi:4-hydroxyphenylacetate 3-monooxygenase